MMRGVRLAIGAGAVVFDRQGNIALLRRCLPPERDCWTLPGGAIDGTESVVKAIIREMREELGVQIDEVTCIGVIDHVSIQNADRWLSFVFTAALGQQTAMNAEPQCHAELAWFALDSPPRRLTRLARVSLSALRSLRADSGELLRRCLIVELRDDPSVGTY